MKWLTLTFCLLACSVLSAAHASDENPSFIIQNDPIAPPSSSYASDPRLLRSPDDTVHLTWIETDGTRSLRHAIYQPGTRTWINILTLATFPPSPPQPAYAVAVGTGQGLAILAEDNQRLVLITSTDSGSTRRDLAPLSGQTRDSFALSFLADGTLLAAWQETAATHRTALWAALIGPGDTLDRQLIDAHTSPGSTPALASFPDGSALIAYRTLTPDNAHEISTARLFEGRWTRPSVLNAENWSPAAPPADGPALTLRGSHLGAAWLTSIGDLRINLSTSSNAGIQWLMPSRVDDVAPVGRPDLVMLDDGGTLVSWIENEKDNESVFLRRLSPRGSLSVPVRLAENISGHPRIVRVKDGDTTPAQILLAHETKTGDGIRTRLITLPDAGLLAEADQCDCDPRPEDQRGYAIKGHVVSVNAPAATVTLTHDDIPGLMKASTTVFKAAPDILAAVKTDSRIFARIERIGPDWWLFNVRTLVIP